MIGERTSRLLVSIVAYRNHWLEVQAVVDSVLRAAARLRADDTLDIITDLIVVDNSESPSLSDSNVETLYQDSLRGGVSFRLLQGQGNIGYGAAHNLALSQVSTDFCLFLNVDVVLDDECLHAGIRYFANNDDVVAISPNASSADGRKQYLCKRYPSIADFFLRGVAIQVLSNIFWNRMAQYEMRDLPEDQATSGIPIISGCCILARRHAIDSVGGFDEIYFLYFEDFDLSLRLASIGELTYLPAMKIQHFGGHASRKDLKHVFLFCRSALIFFKSHGWKWY